MDDFEVAKDKVLMGPERKSAVISDKEKLNTAYHEAGHTLVGMNLPYTDPVHKVSIIPRGQALGVTQTLPSEDRLSLSSERANNFISFNMVCNWGMSKKLGPVKLQKHLNPMYGQQDGYEISEKTSQDIDDEIFNLVDANYKHAMRILQENRPALDRLAKALIVWETINKDQIDKLLAGVDIGLPSLSIDSKKDKTIEVEPIKPIIEPELHSKVSEQT
jgi:cell division protease FtsH